MNFMVINICEKNKCFDVFMWYCFFITYPHMNKKEERWLKKCRIISLRLLSAFIWYTEIQTVQLNSKSEWISEIRQYPYILKFQTGLGKQCRPISLLLKEQSDQSRHCLLFCMNRLDALWYRKDPKFSDTQKICCNHSKIWTMSLYRRVLSPNDADGMANSVDPDQTAPLGAVWSGSALFAQAYICLKT